MLYIPNFVHIVTLASSWLAISSHFQCPCAVKFAKKLNWQLSFYEVEAKNSFFIKQLQCRLAIPRIHFWNYFASLCLQLRQQTFFFILCFVPEIMFLVTSQCVFYLQLILCLIQYLLQSSLHWNEKQIKSRKLTIPLLSTSPAKFAGINKVWDRVVLRHVRVRGED